VGVAGAAAVAASTKKFAEKIHGGKSNMGKIVGPILILIGVGLCVVGAIWIVAAGRGGEGGMSVGGMALGFAVLFIIAVPFVAAGAFLLIRGRQEAAEMAEVEKERKVLNMVQTRGQIKIADVALELDITRDQLKDYIYDLVGKGLFSGYVDWKGGILYSKQASEMPEGNCPNCGGELELAGKGVVSCPYCGSEIFLKG
jgi:DNA-directed RNA polymerase subunit RPC12/RpoP